MLSLARAARGADHSTLFLFSVLLLVESNVGGGGNLLAWPSIILLFLRNTLGVPGSLLMPRHIQKPYVSDQTIGIVIGRPKISPIPQ